MFLSKREESLSNRNNHYCYYCGEKMQDEGSWDEYSYCEEFTCKCEKAQRELDIKYEISKAKDTIHTLEMSLLGMQPYPTAKKVKYQVELNELKDKYGITNA